MPEFLTLTPPREALALWLSHLSKEIETEEVATEHALGRVTRAAVYAPHPLPAFDRSAVDGYAVRAADTFGASDSLPAYLTLVGEVLMGEAPSFSLSPTQCAIVHTGGMLPEGADAVVMLEHTQVVRSGEIEVLRAVAVGENILKAGEEVRQGEEVIPAGKRLRPAEIGGLMALGLTRVKVAKRPLVGILSTGDEVIPPQMPLQPGKVRDVNTYTLSTLIEQSGGLPVSYGIIADQEDDLRRMANKALRECDMVIITAGSSASVRDLTAQVIQEMGRPGVLVHGLSIRPGKPTILAICNGKPVVGLPGNPMSALVIANLFVVPMVSALLGLNYENLPQPSVTARLTINVPSQAGREDWVPVRLMANQNETLAEPIFGKSNMIFALVAADGMVRIPADATGLNANQSVEVRLFL